MKLHQVLFAQAAEKVQTQVLVFLAALEQDCGAGSKAPQILSLRQRRSIGNLSFEIVGFAEKRKRRFGHLEIEPQALLEFSRVT